MPISRVHSIMMEKSAPLVGEGGGCTPTPLHSCYHHVQSCNERSSCEGIRIHSAYFISTPICTLWLHVTAWGTHFPACRCTVTLPRHNPPTVQFVHAQSHMLTILGVFLGRVDLAVFFISVRKGILFAFDTVRRGD